MTATGFTAGDLAPLWYAIETTYGTTPASGWLFGVESTSVTPKDNLHQWSDGWWGGSRSRKMATAVSQRVDAAFTIKGEARSGSELPGLLQCALGTATGTQDIAALPSFSAVINEAGNCLLYNGCKVDDLKISYGDADSTLVYEASVLARYVTLLTNYADAGLQSVTVTPPTVRSTNPAAQIGAVTVTADGSAETVYPLSGTIEISNGLQRQRGTLTGADGNAYQLTVGLAEGRRQITSTMDLFMGDMKYYSQQLANTYPVSSSFRLGTKTLTLNNGRYTVDGSNWPEFQQDVQKQKLTASFESAVIA